MAELLRTAVDPVTLNADQLVDVVVYSQDDYAIGKITHVHDLGYEVEVIVDISAMLGTNQKAVTLPGSEMDFMRDDKGNVFAVVDRSTEEIAALPDHVH